jgi:hypothetical protein
MNESQVELLQLKAHTYDAIKQIEICKYIIDQNTRRIEEIEKQLLDEKNNEVISEAVTDSENN